MRNSVIALAVVACVALPQSICAKEAISLRPAPTEGATRFSDQSELLHQFGIGLIKKVRAAESAEEGETSTEQCCAGLECSGGPPATFTAED